MKAFARIARLAYDLAFFNFDERRGIDQRGNITLLSLRKEWQVP
jgi:hypothetical protein